MAADRRLLFAFVVGALPLLSPAAPFSRTFSFTQPDGAVIELHGEGDEFHAVFETLDGHTVVFDPASKAYCYARQADDGRDVASTGRRVGKVHPPGLSIPKRVRVDRDLARQRAMVRRAKWEQVMRTPERWNALKAVRLAEGGGSGGDASPAPPTGPTLGSKTGLCLLIDFDDDPATVPRAEIVSFCNADNYSGYGNNGSVKQYFLDVSAGRLTYTNVVTVYIRIPNSLHPKSWYNDTSKDCGTQGNLLLRDAIAILRALPNYETEILPTFDSLTVDGSSRVGACNVFYAGGNGGVWAKGLWPHSYALQEVGAQELSSGGKKVFWYQVTNIGSSLELGTFCHENGHLLCDFPDLYDYDYDSKGGAGAFCLMNSGGHGVNPVRVCAYLKYKAGWSTVTELNSNSVETATVVAAPDAGHDHVYRYQKPGVSTEYYLIENRQKTGRDAGLPAAGIAIWHADELGARDNQSTAYNTSHLNYELTLVQADNQWHFQRNVNSGDSTDLYYSGNPAPAYTGIFDDNSTPPARWWSGALSYMDFSQFSASGQTMTFKVGARRFNRLTVASEHGSPSPVAGEHLLATGTVATCFMVGSPEQVGQSQYVCTGWAGSGSATSGVGVSTTFAIQTDTVVAWRWETNYWLDVRKSGSGTVSATSAWVRAGSNVTITATPDEYWLFDGWEGDTNGCAVADRTIEAPMDGARLLRAVFTQPVFRLTVASERGSPSPAAGEHLLATGTVATCLMAGSPEQVGQSQYVCTGWAGSGSATNGVGVSTTFTIQTDTVVAWRWETNYWLDVRKSGSGTVSATSAWVRAGSNVTITATPDEYSLFDGWEGDTNGCAVADRTIEAPMDGARLLRAVFTRPVFPLLVRSTGGAATPPDGLYDVAAGTWFEAVVTQALLDVSGTQEFVLGWTGTGSATGGVGTTVGFRMTNASTLSWLWETQVWFSAVAGPHGTVSASNGWYRIGTAGVVATASCDNGFMPDDWSGDVPPGQGGATALTLTMDRARTVIANQILPPPVMDPEPARTPGGSNRVSWSALAGAAAYQAAMATGAVEVMAGPWTADTSRTFTGLADGVAYDYRVRARAPYPPVSNTWLRTTQADFARDALDNVSASESPGDLLLAAGCVEPAYGRVRTPLVQARPFSRWGRLDFDLDGIVSGASSVVVDVVSVSGQILLGGLTNSVDLDAAGIVEPAFRLEMRFSTVNAAFRPRLREWRVGWEALPGHGVEKNWGQTSQADFLADELHGVNVTEQPGSVRLDTSATRGLRLFVYRNVILTKFLAALAAMGHEVTSASAFPADLSAYDVVILTPGVGAPLAPAPAAAVDAFTAAGGGLVVFERMATNVLSSAAQSCPIAGSSSYSQKRNTISVLASGHPIVAALGPSAAFSSYAASGVAPKSGAQIVSRWNDADQTAHTVAWSNGPGRVVYVNQLNAWYSGNWSTDEPWMNDTIYGNVMMSNILEWVRPPRFCSGVVTGIVVRPPVFGRWTRLNWGATVPGAASFVGVDVLDGSGAALASNVASGSDLSALGITNDSLRLRCRLETTDAAQRPSLENWSLGWMESDAAWLPGPWSAVVTSTQDAPLMGTPISWLDAHGFTERYSVAEQSDPDGDGLLTWQEYVAGCDPTNSGSLFRVDDASGSVGDGFVLEWDTSTGRLYSVWFNRSLDDPWTNRVRQVLGTGGRCAYTNPPPLPAEGYFRIAVEPLP